MKENYISGIGIMRLNALSKHCRLLICYVKMKISSRDFIHAKRAIFIFCLQEHI